MALTVLVALEEALALPSKIVAVCQTELSKEKGISSMDVYPKSVSISSRVNGPV
jgi:hypothetical protein